MKKGLKISLGALTAAVTGIIITENLFLTRVIADSKKSCNEELDYLFVLGGNIVGTETPSEHLLSRIRKAADYLNEHKSTVAIACGGCFRKQQTKSEALIIKEYLMRLGVEEERILLENKSTTTNENFIFGKEILLSHSGKELYELNVGLLSSDYHLYRAGLIAKINGLPALKKVGAKSTTENLIKGTLRELAVAPDLINNYLNRK